MMQFSRKRRCFAEWDIFAYLNIHATKIGILKYKLCV